MLTYNQTYSMLCWLSIAALFVLPPPQPLGCSLPGSFVALFCCCGLPRLTTMLDGRCSAIPGGVFRCSAQELLDFCCRFAPGPVSGTGSLGRLCCPRCVQYPLYYTCRWVCHPVCPTDSSSYLCR